MPSNVEGQWRMQNSLAYMSNEQRVPGCLDYIGDEHLPSYMGIIMNHDKDPYKPTSIMESKGVFFVAHMY